MSNLSQVWADPVRVVVCVGAGGVGKTTASAALAVAAADAGRKVAVLTIDPALRLGQALGVDSAATEPVRVDLPGASGSLDVVMLNMSATLTAAVRRRLPPRQADAVERNPFFRALATSLSGTQEFMAMEKLGQLVEDTAHGWDLVVVDTPPASSALAFVDGPQRLRTLLDSPAMRALAAPTRGSLRFLGSGVAIINAAVDAIIGRRALADLHAFLTSFADVVEGFSGRAERTRRLLSQPETACVVVTSPDAAALVEAAALGVRLDTENMTVAATVVNRLASAAGGRPSSPSGDDLWVWARDAMAEANERHAFQLREVRGQLGGSDLVGVPELSEEPVRLAGLREWWQAARPVV